MEQILVFSAPDAATKYYIFRGIMLLSKLL